MTVLYAQAVAVWLWLGSALPTACGLSVTGQVQLWLQHGCMCECRFAYHYTYCNPCLRVSPTFFPLGILYAAVWTVWSIKVRDVGVLWACVRNTCISGMEQKTVYMEVFGCCGVW